MNVQVCSERHRIFDLLSFIQAKLSSIQQTIKLSRIYLSAANIIPKMQASQTNMSNNKPSTARKTSNHLPNISTPSLNISYSQRYEHVTKIANYNEMHENQIWKEYEKLRICLKELNDEVLYHMERKAFNSFNRPQKISVDAMHQLALIDQQKRLNQERLANFTNQYYQVEQRLKFLQQRKNIIEEMTEEMEAIRIRMRDTRVQNKDFKRKQKMVAKQIQSGPTLQQKLVNIDQHLGSAQRRKGKLGKTLQMIDRKIKSYQERVSQLQKTIQLRLDQFNNQQNFIEQEINFDRFDQLKKQRDNVKRYKSVYQRNYLMKLKELDSLVSSIKRHDLAIQQNQSNIMTMRSDIDSLSTMVLSKNEGRKRAGSSMLINLKQKSREKRNSTVIMDEKNQRDSQILDFNKQANTSKFKSDDKNKRLSEQLAKKDLVQNLNNQNKPVQITKVK